MPTNNGGPIGPNNAPRMGNAPRLRLNKSGARRNVTGKAIRIGSAPSQPMAPANNQTAAAPVQAPQFNVQPSIGVGGPMYSPEYTQYQQNAILGQVPDLNELMKQYDRPGVSRSAGNVMRAANERAQMQAAARIQAATVPLQNHIGNVQQMLAEQIARENETYGIGSRLGSFQDNAVANQNNILLRLLGGLGSIF